VCGSPGINNQGNSYNQGGYNQGGGYPQQQGGAGIMGTLGRIANDLKTGNVVALAGDIARLQSQGQGASGTQFGE
jgi:hypothetical protein